MSEETTSAYFVKKRRKQTTSGSGDDDLSAQVAFQPTLSNSTFGGAITMLPSKFYAKPCHELAKALLGKILVRQLPGGELLKGRIVETEAYPGETDRASHSFKGKTPRNAAMYAKAGTAYVYFIYGMYHNLNVSALEPGAGVLIRGVEPTEGIETMRTLRKSGEQLRVHQLCNGPGKICQAFSILTATHNFHDLTAGQELWLEEGIPSEQDVPMDVVEASRIGIAGYGAEWAQKLWRYYVRDSEHVSKRDKAQELKQFRKNAQGTSSNKKTSQERSRKLSAEGLDER
ncbi:hypothetical protein RvY_17593 [Ramazzottius varieornatus]|uniref:DNA-3-methyladenine glycosylase n=1 Tax=Ramazzottius varieornatus TaxID=947166 RepID=A0A1D1W2N6_RAMVA|nr:hypothetical protein RvY_17593 [Ramazzottius varieornatus]